MAARNKKAGEQNRRLDAFLAQLQIEQEKRERIVRYVEELTFSTLRQKSEPRLRLNKPE